MAAETDDGVVVALPLPAKLCGDCSHAALSPRGVHCLVFSENIWDEKEALTCELFDRAP